LKKKNQVPRSESAAGSEDSRTALPGRSAAEDRRRGPDVKEPTVQLTQQEELSAVLKEIQTEIGAGMVLFPNTAADRAHNNACERANSIIQNYREGFGLFQMTKRLKSIQP